MKRRERGREEEEDKRGQRLREVEVKKKNYVAVACFKSDASFAPQKSSLLVPISFSGARKHKNAPIGRERRSKQGKQDLRIARRLFYLANGSDARRATLDIDDADDVIDKLVEGLAVTAMPPRRASAEECMSRAGNWENETERRAEGTRQRCIEERERKKGEKKKLDCGEEASEKEARERGERGS